MSDVWSVLARNCHLEPVRTKYRLGWRAGISATQLKQFDAHTRVVARWLGSSYSKAKIDYVFIDARSNAKGYVGWCTYGRLRDGRYRSIWIDSRSSWSEQAKTAFHEYAHAFNSYREDHGPLFRLTYLLAWGLYFDVEDKEFRREARRTIKHYSRKPFWQKRAEVKHIQTMLAAARSELMQ